MTGETIIKVKYQEVRVKRTFFWSKPETFFIQFLISEYYFSHSILVQHQIFYFLVYPKIWNSNQWEKIKVKCQAPNNLSYSTKKTRKLRFFPFQFLFPHYFLSLNFWSHNFTKLLCPNSWQKLITKFPSKKF